MRPASAAARRGRGWRRDVSEFAPWTIQTCSRVFPAPPPPPSRPPPPASCGSTPAGGRPSGILWAEGQIVTAEECLAADEGITATLPDGRERAGRACRPRSLDRRGAAARRYRAGRRNGPAAAPPAAGALVLAVGRGGDGPLAALGVVASAGPAWTSAAGGRIDARLRLVLRPAACARGRGRGRRGGRAARARRRRSAAARAGDPGGDRRARGGGAGGARLCRARLSRAGAAAAAARRRRRADRRRGRRGRAGGGGGVCRRRHRHHMGGRAAAARCASWRAGSGRTRSGRRCGSG